MSSIYECLKTDGERPTEYYWAFEGKIVEVNDMGEVLELDNGERINLDVWVSEMTNYKHPRYIKNLLGKRVAIRKAWRHEATNHWLSLEKLKVLPAPKKGKV